MEDKIVHFLQAGNIGLPACKNRELLAHQYIVPINESSKQYIDVLSRKCINIHIIQIGFT